MGQTYTLQDAQLKLSTLLPAWRVEAGGLVRRYETQSFKGALMVINAVGFLAETAWHHPKITAEYNYVQVHLSTHDAGGITDKDFELARKIEDIVSWQPASESGALKGPPAKAAILKR